MRRARSRVTYVLEERAAQGHRLGVNAVVHDPHRDVLYTGSRDGTVRGWDMANKAPPRVLDEHTDWVNDLALCNDGRTLLSVSSDLCIKVWDTETGAMTCSAQRHADYVKAVAVSSSANIVATSGLDCSIYVWDLATLSSAGETPPEPLFAILHAHKLSIYSLAMAAQGNLLASGSPEKVVRLWDPRTGRLASKLVGHADNVKTLALSADGTMCVSGSSDATIKVWDVGQQRCVSTLSIHDDSVWTIRASDDLNTIYSGSRDGSVYHTDRARLKSTLLFRESSPVQSLAVAGGRVWAGTTSSSVHAWAVPEGEASAEHVVDIGPVDDYDAVAPPTPLLTSFEATLAGEAGITGALPLNNRRHVLTRDATGRVLLWDILKGVVEKDLGVRELLEDVAAEMNQLVWMPNWFSLSHKTGSLSVTLEEPSCFAADTFLCELESADKVDDDAQVNLGSAVLHGLFREWRADYQGRMESVRQQSLARMDADGDVPAGVSESPMVLPVIHIGHQGEDEMIADSVSKDDKSIASVGVGSLRGEGGAIKKEASNGASSTLSAPAASSSGGIFHRLLSLGDSKTKTAEDVDATPAAVAAEASSEPIRFELPSSTLVLLSEEVGALGSSATTVRGRVRDMASIAPRLEQFSPTWVFDIVLKDRCSKKEPIKYMFTLKSEDEKEIPMLPANGRRLHANRILRVKKITRFLAEKLSLDAAHEARLELTCNGKVLLPHVNLGSIKNCIWKSSGELVIAYRYRKD